MVSARRRQSKPPVGRGRFVVTLPLVDVPLVDLRLRFPWDSLSSASSNSDSSDSSDSSDPGRLLSWDASRSCKLLRRLIQTKADEVDVGDASTNAAGDSRF